MRLAALVGFARFGEKLVAVFLHPSQIDVDDFDRPEATTARFIAVPIVSIGGSDEQALARFASLFSPVLGGVDFLAAGDEGFQAFDVGDLVERRQLTDFYQPFA